MKNARRALGAFVAALCMLGSQAVAKSGRPGYAFTIHAPHPLAKISVNHPSYVGAREALWSCWRERRACAVTITFEWGDNQSRREDALTEIASDGTPSILYREEEWARETVPGSQISPSTSTAAEPRRFPQLERVRISKSDETAVLAEDDPSGAKEWRLRFVGEGSTKVW